MCLVFAFRMPKVPPTVVAMTPRIALVTGATQGLGLALVAGLAERLDHADIVLLTSRDQGRVDAAVAALGVSSARVVGRVLDVRDRRAVAAFADLVSVEIGGVDIVISNATARSTPDRAPHDQIDDQVEVSNLATSSILRSFLPVLRPGGTLLVVASALGTLGQLPEPVRSLFRDRMTLRQVDAVVQNWRAAVLDGTAEDKGWPHWLNIPSKVAQVAAVRAVARERRDADLAAGTLVASVCPGLIDTGASRPWFEDMSSAQTPEQAAVALLDLALSRPFDAALYGELIQFGAILPWESSTPVGHRTTS
jgi:carbonyl reductase 1